MNALPENIDMLTILGPTASGKTSLAAHLAFKLDGEIISADSRQVYREMDIGTGKDYEDYIVNEKKIPYHIIDIAEPGTEFNVYRFQQEFVQAYNTILKRKKTPILCGGSGFYLESILKGYRLIEVPENSMLREKFKTKSLDDLVKILSSLRNLHSNTDSTDISRTIRAIEIETYNKEQRDLVNDFPRIRSFITGIHLERQILRKRITERLEKRLNSGMVEEVKNLLEKGIAPEKLMHYGLEYKFLTMFIVGDLSYGEMFSRLNTAIHQFAKRQMTWFRKMEKAGTKIFWIDGMQSKEMMVEQIENILKKFNSA